MRPGQVVRGGGGLQGQALVLERERGERREDPGGAQTGQTRFGHDGGV